MALGRWVHPWPFSGGGYPVAYTTSHSDTSLIRALLPTISLWGTILIVKEPVTTYEAIAAMQPLPYMAIVDGTYRTFDWTPLKIRRLYIRQK